MSDADDVLYLHAVMTRLKGVPGWGASVRSIRQHLEIDSPTWWCTYLRTQHEWRRRIEPRLKYYDACRQRTAEIRAYWQTQKRAAEPESSAAKVPGNPGDREDMLNTADEQPLHTWSLIAAQPKT